MQPEELRTLRKQIGMTLAEMAAALGMSIDTVGRMERGVDGYPIEKRTALAVRAIVMLKNRPERVQGCLSDISWADDNERLRAEIGSFTAYLTARTKGRYSIALFHKDGYSPPWPVWENDLAMAKASAILHAQQGMLDIAEMAAQA